MVVRHYRQDFRWLGYSTDPANLLPLEKSRVKLEIWLWINTYRYIFSGMNIHKSQLFWGSLGTRVLTHPHLGMGLVFREHVSYRRHLTYDCRMGMGGRTVAAKQLLATGGGPARSLEVPPEYAAANDQVGSEMCDNFCFMEKNDRC